MRGLGTIVNSLAIIVGGIVGLIGGKLIKERYQETIIKSLGFACIVMALGSTFSQMLVVDITKDIPVISTQGVMMMIVSLAGGALLGEIVDIDSKFENFGRWLRDKSGSQNDSLFIDAFVTTSLTVSIGAMAIIGSIQDGINGDHSTLFAKALLDMILVAMISASMGKGAIFSAIPVAVLQGSVTILATFIAPIMTEAAISNITLVGNVLIVCVGVNLIWPKTVRVANILPSLIIAIIFSAFA